MGTSARAATLIWWQVTGHGNVSTGGHLDLVAGHPARPRQHGRPRRSGGGPPSTATSAWAATSPGGATSAWAATSILWQAIGHGHVSTGGPCVDLVAHGHTPSTGGHVDLVVGSPSTATSARATTLIWCRVTRYGTGTGGHLDLVVGHQAGPRQHGRPLHQAWPRQHGWPP